MKAEQQRTQREERPKRETAHAAPSRQAAVAVSPGGAFDGMGNRAIAALLRSGCLQRKARSAAPANPPDDAKQPISDALGVLGQLDGGRELNRNTREEMEAGFGQSFSNVRIHTGHRAADAAAMFQARAFTAANDIVFGDGEFAPETTEGRRLIAHELAHVAQQNGPEGKASPGTAMAKLSVSEVGDPLEMEADAAADSVLAGRNPMLNSPRQNAMPTISRQPKDKPKKGQTPQDFTVEGEYGQFNSFYIRFPHFIEEGEARKILFANGKVPEGLELEYQGPMVGGWTFRLRPKDKFGVIGPVALEEFTPILQKQFHVGVLALTPEETAAHRKAQDDFLDSKPVYLGGQTVREAMTREHCKDHVVPGQVGTACWGERDGYFYWVGFDSSQGGVTLEAKGSPHTEKVIKDWEWFLSHSPADYVPHVKDLPYAATFDPNSKVTFTLTEAERLENELSNWEFTHEIQAWVGVMQATAGVMGNLRTPAPSTLTGQGMAVAGKAIQTYQAVKAARGGDQSEFDMLLAGLAGALEQGAGMIGNLSGRSPKRPTLEEEPHGTGPSSGGQTGKAVVSGGGDPAAIATEVTGPKPGAIPGGGQKSPAQGELRVVQPDNTLGPPRRARQIPQAPPPPERPLNPSGKGAANDNVPLDAEAQMLPRTGSTGVGDVFASADRPGKPPTDLNPPGSGPKVSASTSSADPGSRAKAPQPPVPEPDPPSAVPVDTPIGNGDAEVHSVVHPDGTVQVTFGDKSTTIRLGETGNASKLRQELGLPDADVRQVLGDLREFLPPDPPKTLISFAIDRPDPVRYLENFVKSVLGKAGPRWGSNAFDHPPVEGARLGAKIGEGEQRLSPYGLVFEERGEARFAGMKSGTVPGLTEYQHPSPQVRTSVEVNPRAVVRVNAEGEIDEVLHNFFRTGSPEGDKEALLALFRRLNWKVAKDLVWRTEGLAPRQ